MSTSNHGRVEVMMSQSTASIATAVVAVVGFVSFPTLAAGEVDAPAVTRVRTRRVSVAADGGQVGRGSEMPTLNTDGRFVAFASRSPKLVAEDSNKLTDVFVRDRQARTTEMVSVSSTGAQGNGPSFPNALSSDGRVVAFTSVASNLVEGDNVEPDREEALDVFVHERKTGVTERISVDSDGAAAQGPSFNADISDDGRFVAFESGAFNLAGDDGDQTFDIFVRDRELGTTELVSVSSTGEAGNFSSFAPSISGDGRFVAFDSDADNLVEGDTNLAADTFVHDRETSTTRLVSVSSTGALGRFGGVDPTITPDGRLVLFLSQSRLVSRDKNKALDAYLHNLQTGRTTLVSRGSTRLQRNGDSFPSGISDDGRYVLFGSFATNLVPHDTNGDFDHFRYDRRANETIRVNVNSRGRQAIGDKGFNLIGRISGDGRFVAFESSASNLVPNDTNNVYDIFARGPFNVPSGSSRIPG
jgi:Tol biopolymer transport system component